MKVSAITAAAVLAFALAGCGSETDTAESSATSVATSETSPGSVAAPAAPGLRIAERELNAPGPAPTIATYVQENGIQETPVTMGEPGAPVVYLPVPEGWVTAGDQTPGWAYSAIAYVGPEADRYQPSIVAMMSKLVGDVDPQRVLDLAPGELQNLPGWSAMNDGKPTTLAERPAFQLGGTWTQDGQTRLVAQKTVVIPGPDAVYVLRLNADALEDQIPIVGPATIDIDDQTTITF